MTNGHNIYGYDPSIAGAVIFILLFGLTTGYHIFQLIQARALYFIPFAIGGVFQVFGYIFRCLGHGSPDSIPIYALQTLLILLAPALYAASIYMVLGRLVAHLHAEHHSLVRVTWMTKIFVTGDVISFLTQCGGGSLMASTNTSTRNLGTKLTMIALLIQIVFFGFFVVTAVVFHIRLSKRPTPEARTGTSMYPGGGDRWLQRRATCGLLLTALYTVSGLILIRSVFRLVEFIDGYGGYLMTHEAFLYVFDTLPMWATMVVMNGFHPCYVICGSGKGEGGYQLGDL